MSAKLHTKMHNAASTRADRIRVGGQYAPTQRVLHERQRTAEIVPEACILPESGNTRTEIMHQRPAGSL